VLAWPRKDVQGVSEADEPDVADRMLKDLEER
jgi:hypothetical protein